MSISLLNWGHRRVAAPVVIRSRVDHGIEGYEGYEGYPICRILSNIRMLPMGTRAKRGLRSRAKLPSARVRACVRGHADTRARMRGIPVLPLLALFTLGNRMKAKGKNAIEGSMRAMRAGEGDGQ